VGSFAYAEIGDTEAGALDVVVDLRLQHELWSSIMREE